MRRGLGDGGRASALAVPGMSSVPMGRGDRLGVEGARRYRACPRAPEAPSVCGGVPAGGKRPSRRQRHTRQRSPRRQASGGIGSRSWPRRRRSGIGAPSRSDVALPLGCGMGHGFGPSAVAVAGDVPAGGKEKRPTARGSRARERGASSEGGVPRNEPSSERGGHCPLPDDTAVFRAPLPGGRPLFTSLTLCHWRCSLANAEHTRRAKSGTTSSRPGLHLRLSPLVPAPTPWRSAPKPTRGVDTAIRVRSLAERRLRRRDEFLGLGINGVPGEPVPL